MNELPMETLRTQVSTSQKNDNEDSVAGYSKSSLKEVVHVPMEEIFDGPFASQDLSGSEGDGGWIEDSDEEVPALRKLSDINDDINDGDDDSDFDYDESFLATSNNCAQDTSGDMNIECEIAKRPESTDLVKGGTINDMLEQHHKHVREDVANTESSVSVLSTDEKRETQNSNGHRRKQILVPRDKMIKRTASMAHSNSALYPHQNTPISESKTVSSNENPSLTNKTSHDSKNISNGVEQKGGDVLYSLPFNPNNSKVKTTSQLQNVNSGLEKSVRGSTVLERIGPLKIDHEQVRSMAAKIIESVAAKSVPPEDENGTKNGNKVHRRKQVLETRDTVGELVTGVFAEEKPSPKTDSVPAVPKVQQTASSLLISRNVTTVGCEKVAGKLGKSENLNKMLVRDVVQTQPALKQIACESRDRQQYLFNVQPASKVKDSVNNGKLLGGDKGTKKKYTSVDEYVKDLKRMMAEKGIWNMVLHGPKGVISDVTKRLNGITPTPPSTSYMAPTVNKEPIKPNPSVPAVKKEPPKPNASLPAESKVGKANKSKKLSVKIEHPGLSIPTTLMSSLQDGTPMKDSTPASIRKLVVESKDFPTALSMHVVKGPTNTGKGDSLNVKGTVPNTMAFVDGISKPTRSGHLLQPRNKLVQYIVTCPDGQRKILQVPGGIPGVSNKTQSGKPRMLLCKSSVDLNVGSSKGPKENPSAGSSRVEVITEVLASGAKVKKIKIINKSVSSSVERIPTVDKDIKTDPLKMNYYEKNVVCQPDGTYVFTQKATKGHKQLEDHPAKVAKEPDTQCSKSLATKGDICQPTDNIGINSSSRRISRRARKVARPYSPPPVKKRKVTPSSSPSNITNSPAERGCPDLPSRPKTSPRPVVVLKKELDIPRDVRFLDDFPVKGKGIVIKSEPLSDEEAITACEPSLKITENKAIKTEPDYDSDSTDIPTDPEDIDEYDDRQCDLNIKPKEQLPATTSAADMCSLPRISETEYLSRAEKMRLLQQRIEEQESILENIKKQRLELEMQRQNNPYLEDLL